MTPLGSYIYFKEVNKAQTLCVFAQKWSIFGPLSTPQGGGETLIYKGAQRKIFENEHFLMLLGAYLASF